MTQKAARKSTKKLAEAEKLTQIISGEPVRFECGGREWAIRQPTPAEITKLLFWREVGEAQAWEMLNGENALPDTQVADAVANAAAIGYLQGRRSMTEDAEEQSRLDERIAQMQSNDPTKALDNQVMAYAIAFRDMKAIEMLLDAPANERDTFTGNVVAMNTARQHVQIAIALAYEDPNF